MMAYGYSVTPAKAPKAAPIPPEHTAAMLADYPPAARAAGIEGRASLSCARMLHGAPDACTVISEQPRGQGFGAAALALVRRAPQSASLPVLPETDPLWRIDFAFTLKPAPAITPDVFGPLHVPPHWEKTVASDQILQAYPTGALSSNTEGFVILLCTVAIDGRMTNCVAKANPTRFGFEQAALKLAPTFKLQARTDDGSSTAGTTITIPILFALP
jgi:TonB family protein